MIHVSVRRGDIFYADLSPVVGSEQGGLRPVLIVQNDVGNKYSPTVIAAAITSKMSKTHLPTHIDIYADKVGLATVGVVTVAAAAHAALSAVAQARAKKTNKELGAES